MTFTVLYPVGFFLMNAPLSWQTREVWILGSKWTEVSLLFLLFSLVKSNQIIFTIKFKEKKKLCTTLFKTLISPLKMGKGQPVLNIFVLIKVKYFLYFFISSYLLKSLASNYCYKCEKTYIFSNQYIYSLKPQPQQRSTYWSASWTS